MQSSRQRTSVGVDHTFFSRENPRHSNVRHCQEFAKELGRRRCVAEFETGNEKRLIRKMSGTTNSRYYVGQSQYTSRPPTGVDLALGLNGYKDPNPLPPPRVPTTLQRMDQKDHRPSTRAFMDEASKWSSVKSEVEERRLRESQERKKAIEAAQEKMVKEGSSEIREEKSRQIHKALPKDWDYQMELKEREMQRAKELEEVDASQTKESIEDEKREELMKNRQAKTDNLVDQERFLENVRERKFREEFEDQRSKEILSKNYGKEVAENEVEMEAETETEKRRKKAMAEELRDQILDRKTAEIEDAEMEKKVEEIKFKTDSELTKIQKEEAKREIRENENKITNFNQFRSEIDKRRHLESDHVSALIHKDSKDIEVKEKSERLKELEKRRQNNSHFSSFLMDQIREREAREKENQELRRRAEEKRLEEEERYQAILQADKERKKKEQINYRNYLKSQMDERRKIRERQKMENERFFEEVKSADNALVSQIHHGISQVTLHPDR